MDMPVTLGNDQIIDMEPTRYYQTVGIPERARSHRHTSISLVLRLKNLENLNEDLTLAARHALLQMIDYLVGEHGLTKEQYMSSVLLRLICVLARLLMCPTMS